MSKQSFKKLASCLLLMLLMFLVVSCSGNSEPANNNNNSANMNISPVNNNQAAKEPQYGGTLKMIGTASALNLGHPTEGDYASVYPAVEPLLAVSDERELEGVLAKAWEEDPDNLTITFYLQEGIKFHDGSDFNAEVAKWNFEIAAERYRLRFFDHIDRIEAVDDYTLVIHINQWHNQIIEEWGIKQMFSKQAWETHDESWFSTNVVGTGPFKLEEFVRDSHIYWVKNEDYWQEGYPYLDRIEIIDIPEPTTAAAAFEAGEARAWLNADNQYAREFVDKGYVRNEGWAGMQTVILFNNAEGELFSDKRLREAVEYAIDKQAISDALGYGFSEPIYAVAPPGDWGGHFKWRDYDPEKAKQLLQEAGYNGEEVILLASNAGGRNDMAEAIYNYLRAVGFNVKIDLADLGRFGQALYNDGWKHLALSIAGQDTNYLTSIQRWWGHDGTLSISFIRPAELIEMSRASLLARTTDEKKAWAEKIVKYIGDEALVIPILNQPSGFLHDGTVHTSYPKQGFTRWKMHEMWIEP
ncbi:MAG: ABC transporter substrate-binding protein [Firmicutes bacterium]|nr:ABC transporter substrate-binding protein [Bacillota bacterium]